LHTTDHSYILDPGKSVRLDEILDASDASHMTTGRLNALRILLRHPDISLYTLNAPQTFMRGVTPLGMAAWLNWEDAVRVLLEESAETVSVDGMDSCGATALMCEFFFFVVVGVMMCVG
jgi:hypothetical protein